jgi:predicted NBD/HSP70 family sugar kinase
MLPTRYRPNRLATTRDIRNANGLQILHQLLLRKTSTRQELSQLTGLSTATVAALVSLMLAEGLVVETGVETPHVGRPTAILALNSAGRTCVGIDVAETYIHYELYDLTLQQLAHHTTALPAGKKEAEEVVQLVAVGFDELLSGAGVARDKVVGAGVSIPGPFDHATGVSVFAPTWGWVNVPLQAMLEQALQLPLYLDNPLKFTAIAEAWFGAGRSANTLAALVLGTGVGAGLVIDGQLFHGASNTAGEWGHTVIVAGGRQCRCGNRGCLEAYVGAPGILQTLLAIDQHSPLHCPDDETCSIQAIAAAAKRDDPVAVAVVNQTAVYLSAGLSSLINVFNPEVVVLGSWVAALLGPLMLENLIQLVKQQSLARPFQAARFVLSDIASSSVSLGAATLVLEEFLAQAGSTAQRKPSVRGGNR